MIQEYIGFHVEQWKEWNDIVQLICETDKDYRELTVEDKAFCLSVSAGWPIAKGDAIMLDTSDAGLRRIAEGAILIAHFKPQFPIPEIVEQELNKLYEIMNP